MTYTILAVLSRKPGLTPTQFKSYYETTHVPLVKEIAGSHPPTVYKRYYLPRAHIHGQGGIDDTNAGADADTSNTAYPVTTALAGNPSGLQFDVYTEMVFEDENHFGSFQAALEENSERVKADEAAFLDTSRIHIVKIDGPFA
ncbi:hypothetical protein ASPVEDRAFT_45579 [Aspergillus versicolor CBS 583.65]|uniref:EthD domain-containing protein n=1 Tax=Aspergillus versicolor CBS 583.65 TaxID=1036611 RepID=A0A1L9PX87_ASPVE|nr:uncharacterized protein ASPVEDRAFT_45579 [Aspergillus versicolor CBS 583.65]OJJ06161.1 hypothetical protein ASPVEDRAFT_45579 [Aspergillus versicolor CBS 583.65]